MSAPQISEAPAAAVNPDLANAIAYITKHPTRYLFPTIEGKGRPAFKNNLELASNDPAQLIAWNDEHKHRGRLLWACATKKSGLVCVDVDMGPGKEGKKSFIALKEAGLIFPKTEKAQTPSGGVHLIFTGEHHFSGSKLGLHIDTPNYFMVPGTKRSDGKTYQLLSGDTKPAPLPDWAAEKIKRRKDRERKPPGPAIPVDLFKRMLAAVPYTGGPEGMDDRHEYDGWLSFAMACHEAAGGDEADYLWAFTDWSQNDPHAKEEWTFERIERHWLSFDADPPEHLAAITRASLFKLLVYFKRLDLVNEAGLSIFEDDGEPWDNDNDPTPEDEAVAPDPGMTFSPSLFTDPDPFTIEPRDWLYGLHYIRKFVVADVAPGGTIKTSNALAEAIAMATGADILMIGTDRMPTRPLKVWYWSGEDTVEEINRRLAAAIKLYTGNTGVGDNDEVLFPASLLPEQRALLKTNLFVDTGRHVPIKLAVEDVRTGFKIAQPVIDALVNAITANGIDVLIVDPFIDSHSISENDNSRIEAVVAAWRNVAERANCCICLVHHTRKGKRGGSKENDADDARGATALVDAARDVRVYNVMDNEEADTFHVPRKDCWRYIRVSSGKPNMAARGDLSSWRYIESVSLLNARHARPGELRGRPADSVGVVLPWSPPEKDPLTEEATRDAILKAARALFDEGVRVTYDRGRNRIANMVPAFRERTGLDTISASDITKALQKACNDKPATWTYINSHGGRSGAGYHPVEI